MQSKHGGAAARLHIGQTRVLASNTPHEIQVKALQQVWIEEWRIQSSDLIEWDSWFDLDDDNVMDTECESSSESTAKSSESEE